ncbi:uncharacterized protein LOC116604121 isoform X3 [Nematostella vectensis]|uniref:uncharacterized protein LOC116604121 isoform X3 n=1 Tax=Nematostella vectensis TaxID=45351 RepID=UPI00138FEFE0|nr:uncharacterized protein LOC116604121 isoform X3 [Nematostella vectensis]
MTPVDETFDEQVGKFQIALFRHYDAESAPLYDPATMRDFAEKNAPGLYSTILNSITRCKHSALQEQRTVTLLHTLAYFRSQKTSRLQKDLGLYLHLHGLSRSALNSGLLTRFGCAPRTIASYNKAKKKTIQNCSPNSINSKALPLSYKDLKQSSLSCLPDPNNCCDNQNCTVNRIDTEIQY